MKNILVYVKTKNDKKFNALSSLRNFTYAPSLMYACLIPEDKKDRLIHWANQFKEICIKNEVKIELRYYKRKSFYSVG